MGPVATPAAKPIALPAAAPAVAQRKAESRETPEGAAPVIRPVVTPMAAQAPLPVAPSVQRKPLTLGPVAVERSAPVERGREAPRAAPLPALPLAGPKVIHAAPAEAAPVVDSSATQTVQRLVVPGFAQTVSSAAPMAAAPAAPQGTVQRISESQAAANAASDVESAPPPNLDDLARKVMPIIKRMLVVERERRQLFR